MPSNDIFSSLCVPQVFWLRTGQLYVKKTLPSALFASTMQVQGFETEMAVLREYQSPNLVRHFDGAANAKRREAFIVRTAMRAFCF